MSRRIPPAVKEITGTTRADRLPPPIQKPARATLAPPATLSPGAHEAWASVAPMLARMGTVTEADAWALEALCETWADLKSLRAILAGYGAPTYAVVTREGNTVHRPYPEVAMAADTERRLSAWLARFGLTPADRSRVAPGEPEAEEDPWDILAAGPRQN